MVPSQLVPIDFTGGLEKGKDAKLILPGKLSTLDNGVFGAANTISKRAGYQQVTTGNVLAAFGGGLPVSSADILTGKRLATRGDELLVEAASGLHAVVKATGTLQAGTALRTAQFTRVGAELRELVRTAADIVHFDVAAGSGNLFCAAWIESDGSLYVGLWDNATKTLVRKSSALAGQSYVRVLYDSAADRFRIYSAPTGSFNIVQISFAVNGGSGISILMSPTTVANDNWNIGTPGPFDVVYDSANNFIYLAYGESAGNNLKLRKLGAGIATLFSRTIVGANPLCVAVNVFSNGKPFVGYTNAGGYAVHVYATDLSSDTSMGVAGNFPGRIVCAPSGANMLVLWDIGTAGSISFDTNRQIEGAVYNDTPANVSSCTVARSVGIASKLFLIGTTYYVAGLFPSATQPTLFVFEVDDDNNGLTATIRPNTVARLLESRSSAHASMPPSVPVGMEAAEMATLFAFARGVLQSAAGTDVTPDGVAAASLAFTTTASPLERTELGGGLCFGGACPLYYDGVRVTELGFHTQPDAAMVTLTPSAGGSLAAGVYQVAVGYECTDALGRRWYSLFSTPKSFTAALNDRVTVVAPMDRLTRRITGEVKLCVFRTKAGGTTFYRDNPSTGSLVNNPAVNTVSLVFTTSDAALAGGELLPTTGNALDSEPFPAHRLSVVHQGRLFMAGLENPLQLRFTSQLLDGYSVEANEAYQLEVPPTFGKLTGLGSMDDKLVASCERGTWYFAGEGPNRLGLQSTYSPPQVALADVGCRADSPWMVLASDGLWLRSEVGLRLLTRGLALGRNAEGAELGSEVDPLVTGLVAALVVKTQQQVRFFSGSDVLVWDYAWGQWSRFTNFEAVDAVEWQGVVTHLRSDGTLYSEGGVDDAGEGVNLTVETAWLKFASLQGFQRVRRFLLLGTYFGASDLVISFGYDYEDVFPYAIDVDTSIFVSGEPLQMRHHLTRQKCEALRVRIAESGGGASFSFSNFTLDVGLKKGGFKLPAGKTV